MLLPRVTAVAMVTDRFDPTAVPYEMSGLAALLDELFSSRVPAPFIKLVAVLPGTRSKVPVEMKVAPEAMFNSRLDESVWEAV